MGLGTNAQCFCPPSYLKTWFFYVVFNAELNGTIILLCFCNAIIDLLWPSWALLVHIRSIMAPLNSALKTTQENQVFKYGGQKHWAFVPHPTVCCLAVDLTERSLKLCFFKYVYVRWVLSHIIKVRHQPLLPGGCRRLTAWCRLPDLAGLCWAGCAMDNSSFFVINIPR